MEKRRERGTRGGGERYWKGDEEERRKRRAGRRDREGSKRGKIEEKEDGKVDKVVMDATIQLFVKADGMRTVTMEMSPTDKVHNVVGHILNTVSGSDQDVYVTSDGRVLNGNEEVGSRGVRDGSTVQVVSRLRGGGRHKDKQSQTEKMQAACSKIQRSRNVTRMQ